jgi:uncharacterized membrane protein
MNKYTLIGLILFIVGFIIIITTIVLFTEEKGSKVDCFDKYGSKIQGMTCISNNGQVSEEGEIYLNIGFILCVLGLSICGFFAGFEHGNF